MKHFFINDEQLINEKQILLRNEHYTHIIKSLRYKINDKIFFIYKDYKISGKIVKINKTTALVEIKEKKKIELQQNFLIDIFIPILKDKVMHFLIEKLTEIGINSINFIQTKYSIINSISPVKMNRFIKISKLASQQSGRYTIPIIKEVKKLKEINFNEYESKILFSETAEKNVNSLNIKLSCTDKIFKICYLIGPEGGLTNDEIKFLSSIGFKILKLDNRILRSETAAILGGFILKLKIIENLKSFDK